MTLGVICAADAKSDDINNSLNETLNRTLVESDERMDYYAAWHYLQNNVMKPACWKHFQKK